MTATYHPYHPYTHPTEPQPHCNSLCTVVLDSVQDHLQLCAAQLKRSPHPAANPRL